MTQRNPHRILSDAHILQQSSTRRTRRVVLVLVKASLHQKLVEGRHSSTCEVHVLLLEIVSFCSLSIVLPSLPTMPLLPSSLSARFLGRRQSHLMNTSPQRIPVLRNALSSARPRKEAAREWKEQQRWNGATPSAAVFSHHPSNQPGSVADKSNHTTIEATPETIAFTGNNVIPVTSKLHIVTPEEDTPRGKWPIFRLMVRCHRVIDASALVDTHAFSHNVNSRMRMDPFEMVTGQSIVCQPQSPDLPSTWRPSVPFCSRNIRPRRNTLPRVDCYTKARSTFPIRTPTIPCCERIAR